MSSIFSKFPWSNIVQIFPPNLTFAPYFTCVYTVLPVWKVLTLEHYGLCGILGCCQPETIFLHLASYEKILHVKPKCVWLIILYVTGKILFFLNECLLWTLWCSVLDWDGRIHFVPMTGAVEGWGGDGVCELTVWRLQINKMQLLFGQIDDVCLVDNQVSYHTSCLLWRLIRDGLDLYHNHLQMLLLLEKNPS